MHSLLKTSLVVGVTLITSCDDAKFASGGDNKKPATNDQVPGIPLTVNCDPSGNNSTQQNVIPVPVGSRFQIQGEICPRGVGQLSVLFLVDFSQSMQFPEQEQAQYGAGNDPLQNNTCGRLEAAKAIINLLKSKGAGNDAIDISVVQFSSNVIQGKGAQGVALAQFDQHLKTETFCGAESMTNYAAGIREAKNVLAARGQNRVIYFITDGKPLINKVDANGVEIKDAQGVIQKDGEKAASEGLQAIQELKSAIPNITFYSLFLGNTVSNPETAVSYLNQLSGSPDNVRVADNAGQLAEKIQQFTIPTLGIDPASMMATLQVPGKEARPVRIVDLKPSQRGGSATTFTSEPINAIADNSIFVLKAKTQSGIVQEVQAIFRNSR